MVYRPIWYCLYVPLWGDVYSTGCLLRQSYAWLKMVRRCSDSSLNVFNGWKGLGLTSEKPQNPYGLKHTLHKSLNTDVSSYASFYVLLRFEMSLISIHSSTFCIFSVATRGNTVGISVNVFFTVSFLFQVNYYYGSLRLASAKKKTNRRASLKPTTITVSRSCWCAQAGHQMSLSVEHMACCLFGAMCSHVDCLSPPILLRNHCFSGSSCVSLVCLPI